MSQFNVHKWNADRREASLNEGVTEFLGNGVIKIMDYAFFAIMADNEESFNLLMDTLKNATNEEKAEMLTNLSKFRLKPTLSKLAQAELANIGTRNDQLKNAFREDKVDEAMMGPAEIFKEKILQDLSKSVVDANKAGAIDGTERSALMDVLASTRKRRAQERGE
tara:strand:- start:4293 stop:4787 length:495 start_codon:yes stop_codon:yes gene_type:complete